MRFQCLPVPYYSFLLCSYEFFDSSCLSSLFPRGMSYSLINYPRIFLAVNILAVSCLIQSGIFLSFYQIPKTVQSSGVAKINKTESLPSFTSNLLTQISTCKRSKSHIGQANIRDCQRFKQHKGEIGTECNSNRKGMIS